MQGSGEGHSERQGASLEQVAGKALTYVQSANSFAESEPRPSDGSGKHGFRAREMPCGPQWEVLEGTWQARNWEGGLGPRCGELCVTLRTPWAQFRVSAKHLRL